MLRASNQSVDGQVLPSLAIDMRPLVQVLRHKDKTLMQNKTYRVVGILALTLLCVTALNADSFTVGPVNDGGNGWNPPGSHGQVNGDFQVLTIDNFAGGGVLELGLRAQERRVGPIVPNGSTYYVNPGPDPGTSLAWWNFDWSGYWDGAASGLDHLYLTIGVNGGPGSQFDLLADPQDSSNLAYGWVSPFDMNAPDTYQFSLTAVKSGFDSKTVSMDVDVVAAPEPSELALSTVIFGAILILLRRRKLAA